MYDVLSRYKEIYEDKKKNGLHAALKNLNLFWLFKPDCVHLSSYRYDNSYVNFKFRFTEFRLPLSDQ